MGGRNRQTPTMMGTTESLVWQVHASRLTRIPFQVTVFKTTEKGHNVQQTAGSGAEQSKLSGDIPAEVSCRESRPFGGQAISPRAYGEEISDGAR